MGPSARCQLLLLALVALALLAGGCGLGAGRTPPGVRLEITRDFGTQVLRSLPVPREQGQETALSLLLRNASVKTSDGGGLVEDIDGHSGGHEGSQPVDWFYYVDGVEASRGAAETSLSRGNRVWWDLHDWSQAEDVPAVVGSFPEPFLNGVEGHRLAVRVECAEPTGDPCRTVAARLRAAAVESTPTSLGAGAGARAALRVLVGTWRQVRGEAGAASLERGPRLSGVYARVRDDGRAIALLDAQGEVVRTLTGSAGLVAATRAGGGPPEWVVTATDTSGLERAAGALAESTLRDRFAVAITAGGSVLALPRPSA